MKFTLYGITKDKGISFDKCLFYHVWWQKIEQVEGREGCVWLYRHRKNWNLERRNDILDEKYV